MRVTVAGHSAILPVIDKGPSAGGRKIDITGAGVKALGIAYGAFPTDAVGTAELLGGSRSSGGGGTGGGSGASQAHQVKQASRTINTLSGPAFVGIHASAQAAARLGGRIDSHDTTDAQVSRGFDQSTEDLGTKGGRDKRVSEIAALTVLKKKQLGRRQSRATALQYEVGKYEGLIRKIKGLLRGKHRLRGAAAAKAHERLRGYEDNLDSLKAERVALGFAITDTKLDLTDLKNESDSVAGTPDTAVDTSGASSGASSGTSAVDTSAVDAAAGQEAHIDAQVRAGDLTVAQGTAAKIAAVQAAINGADGPLTADQLLALRGDLKDLTDAISGSTADTTAALQSLQASIDKQNAYAESVTAVTGREVSRALADLMNGELVGVGLRGRNATAGAGSVTRY